MENLDSEFFNNNFTLLNYGVDGISRKFTKYELTETGFYFLAMGYGGKESAFIKLKL